MTAPHILNPAALLEKGLADASPDLMRTLLATVINAFVNGHVEVPVGGQEKSPPRCGCLANSVWRLPSCGRRGASGRTRRR